MSITVLLADYHAVVRDGLRILLEAQADIMVIGEADNGKDAVRLALQHRPDVVIMDIAVPKLNGIEATKQICKECSSIGVIILSIYSTHEYIVRALEAGARGYIFKEAAGNEVVRAVREVSSKLHYFCANIPAHLVRDCGSRSESAERSSSLESLSPREREILQLVVEGKTSATIAGMFHLSPKTIDTYRSRLMAKLGTKDVPSLVKFAIRHGLTTLKY